LSFLIHNREVQILDLEKYEILKKLGIFRINEATQYAKISQPTLSRWAQKGLIHKVARGLYMHPKAPIDPEDLDFAIACSHFGSRAIIGGLSALFHYGLIEQVPEKIWVVLPQNKKEQGKSKRYRCFRVETSHNIGVEKYKYYKISGIERTLVESLKFASKIGPRIVIQALRKALREGKITEIKLGNMAKKLKMKKHLEKYWEVIVP
jgi:predicted transcriptional regulator of viral defense system